MTRRRWMADEVSGNRAALIGEHADHLARVLRVRVGQQFDIATETGVHIGTVANVSDSRVEFELGTVLLEESAPEITLALAIFKFDRMEWAIEKCTELGVARVIPVIAQRSESHLATAAAKRMERWQRIARQASEQSRRSAPPEISQPLKLKDVLQSSVANRVVLSESERGVRLRDISSGDGAIILAVGPEGGWTGGELNLFRDAAWTPASLGSTILRAETAAIAAVAIVRSLLR